MENYISVPTVNYIKEQRKHAVHLYTSQCEQVIHKWKEYMNKVNVLGGGGRMGR